MAATPLLGGLSGFVQTEDVGRGVANPCIVEVDSIDTDRCFNMLPCRRSPRVCVEMAVITCAQCAGVQLHPAPEANQSDSRPGEAA